MPRLSALSLGLLTLTLSLAPVAPARAAEETPASGHDGTAAHAKADATGPGAASGHGEAQPDILEFKPPLAITTVIVFVALLAVLWRFAWGPLSEALAERERKHEETLRHADEAKAESARLLAEHKRQMDTAAEQVRQMLDEARRQADANAQTIVQKAQAEAEASRERAEREIGSAKDQALNEIWSRTADLAVAVAGRVLSKELSHDDHRRLVDSAVGELPAAGANGHGHGGRLA